MGRGAEVTKLRGTNKSRSNIGSDLELQVSIKQIVGLSWLFMMVKISGFWGVFFSERQCDSVKLEENSNLFFWLRGTAITTWDAKKKPVNNGISDINYQPQYVIRKVFAVLAWGLLLQRTSGNIFFLVLHRSTVDHQQRQVVEKGIRTLIHHGKLTFWTQSHAGLVQMIFPPFQGWGDIFRWFHMNFQRCIPNT